MRLQKFLARAGVASRRACEKHISDGRVSVNGNIVTEMGAKVDPESDRVEFDGKLLCIPEERVVLMLNKPKGYLSAMSDERETRLVKNLVPADEYPGLFPIGRLDKDTTGLLLFTNDGELGNALLHPSRDISKRYIALVEGKLTGREARMLEEGIELDDGMTSPAVCEIIEFDVEDNQTLAALEIHEGRKRQVRRMFSAIGHEVVNLERTVFGPLSLDGLDRGEWRKLDPYEIDILASSCKLQ